MSVAIGSLAAALGVGLAIAATPGVASAAPSDGAATPVSSTTAPESDTTTVRSAAPSRAQRTATRRGGSPAPGAARAGVTVAVPQHNSASTTVQPTAAIPALRVTEPTPVSAADRAATTLTTPAAAADSAPAPAGIATARTPVATAAIRPVAAVAHRRAVATAVAVAQPAGSLADTALGGGPLSDAQSPMLWAALAVARRQPLRPTAQNTVASATTSSLVMGPNLLLNPGAEVGDPSLSGFAAVTVPGWTLAGTPTVIKYGTPRNLWPIGLSFAMPDLPSFLGFPKACTNTDGGNQFFGGGNVATSKLTQVVDLTAAKNQIDTGTVTFNLGGDLGGFFLDPSAASVKVTFLDTNKTYLGTAKIGPVTVLDRWLQTGFQQRQTSGTLPMGTRYAQVELDLQDCNPRLLGFRARYNNAYADNLSFSISAPLTAPTLEPPPSNTQDLDHFYMVYMENKGYDDILGSPNAPFLNSLINAFGFAGNYYGLTHPSSPNYYPIVGGTDFGKTYNCATPCIDASTTLVSNIDDADKVWRSYAQSLAPGASPLVSAGDYSVDQTVFPAFTSIGYNPAYASEHIFPLEQMAIDLQSADTAPNFGWFAANEDFNGEGPVGFPWGALKFALSQITPGHQYNVPALDQFLSETVPVVLNSQAWNTDTVANTNRSVLVVTFDEDNNNTSLGFGNEGNHIITVVIPNKDAIDAGMRAGSFTATDHYNHYSLLRFIEESLGLTPLTNNDRYAAAMNEFWTGTPTV